MSSDNRISDEEDLLKIDPPSSENHEERIHFLAKVLAHGTLTDQWSPKFGITPREDPENRQFVGENWGSLGHTNYSKRLHQYLKTKWEFLQPQASFLESLGYLQRIGTQGAFPHERTFYILTSQAYDLLQQPVIPPKVFISYCHETSSAFAMMIEYRLQVKQIPVFIDRSIPKGDPWHERLKNTVQSCPFFVCLITKEALESKYVRSEIQWAEKQRRIPIWHPGFKYCKEPEHPDWLQEFVESKQAIRVLEESAESYHDVVEKLLNELGFA
ncbi:MAG: toll/interleukin-1 receptor domain-containing protein [Anaerolineae bacterium]|nr:toll/interleukin-1 receptor domain-containing protein [Anaerolineae bacterium]